jgi:CRP/FNR family cyclic AMP-dependent transcriptional regulator
MKDNRLSQLCSIELFSCLSLEDLREIAPRISFKEFAKNEIILHEEDTHSFMYAVIDGKLKVYQTAEDGKEAVVAFHGAGMFFGEMSLIDGRTAPATVAAVENSTVALVSKKDFEVLLQHKSFLDGLLKVLCLRLRDSWRRIQMLGAKHADQRIRMLLCMLAEDSSSERSKGYVTLGMRLTHQNIADLTGLTRETVTRVIDRWIKSGEVSLDEDRKICLSDAFLEKRLTL